MAISDKSFRFRRVSAKSSARYAQSTLAQRSIEIVVVVVVPCLSLAIVVVIEV